jgi:hypothetical protein
LLLVLLLLLLPCCRWSLDSRLQAPSSFLMTEADVANGGAIRLHRYLQQQLVGGAHIMLVYTQQLDAKA